MTTDEQLKALWEARRDAPATLRWVKATSVNAEERTMDADGVADGLPYYGIQLGAGSVTVYPKVGSLCLAAMIEGSGTDAVLVSATEAERITVDASAEIVFNGGGNGGLINIGALTEKINALVDAFNGHTHTIPSNGIATAGNASAQTNQKPVTVPAIQSKAQAFNRSDYEDKLIKH